MFRYHHSAVVGHDNDLLGIVDCQPEDVGI